VALALVLLAIAWIGSSSASAAVVSGSNLAAEPDDETCLTPPAPLSCTIGLSALPSTSRAPGGTRAGISGVIVGWRVRTATSLEAISMRLRVIHGVTGAGTGAIETLPAVGGIYSFTARLPVKEGDELAIDFLDVGAESPRVLRKAVSGAQFEGWIPPLGDGEERGPEGLGAKELLMNATIEPDADRDGFGDETQDGCPSSPATASPCPAMPGAAPDTKITKGPKGRIDSHRATFKFKSDPAGATFECRLDGKKFKSCRSPQTYRGLAAGKHTFRVRAVAAGGAVDESPAKRSFRVEP
jgi:hypothetical protein